ncbi:sensor histidine kinase [Maribellus comscasis]|nr:sensor histidine kinase [Maribellus comscasis]
MKLNSHNTKRGEVLVYTIIWLVIFLMPVFMSRSGTGFDWYRIGHEWLRILPYLLVFVIHNFLLFPQLFLKRKRFEYIFITLLFVVIIATAWVLGGRYLVQSIEIFPSRPPGLLANRPGIPMPIRPWYVNFSEIILVSVLVVGFNAAIKLTVKWQEEEQKNRILEKEKLEAELAFLRNQVSPHFFMNTLNNIHALIDIDSENAKESIVKLSRLMRYLLYDSEKGETTLQKEVEFIKNYVELMKLRMVSDVRIELSFPGKIPEVKIPPLLFVSLVENAFKYGVSYQAKSFIGVFMRLDGDRINFRVNNSIHNSQPEKEKGGLGLKNLKKRLKLIYNDNFLLETKENDNSFEINIKLPLHGY